MEQAVVKTVEDVLCFPAVTVFPKTYSPGLKPGVSSPSFILEKTKLDSESQTAALQTSTLACKSIKPDEILALHRQRSPKQCAAQGLFGSGCWHRSEPH